MPLSSFMASVPDDWRLDIQRKKIRHIYFRVYPAQKKIGVSAPVIIDSHALEQAILAKSSWILKQIRTSLKQPMVTHGICEGDICYFRGDQLVLRVVEGSGPQGAALDFQGGLVLHVRPKSSFEKKGRILAAWYRSQLKEQIALLLEKWQPLIGVKTREFGVKKMKTRWGSCNTHAKRIWINIALIHMAPCFLEYVLVHELVHLLERSHNQRFHSFMDHFVPDWPILKKKLNQFEL
ncbi:MAG: M48 family metallopeptidase [Desulfobacteraceae bacterium]|nr:M48 family metallopeptidase [Desulfobacteraceae bacterium]